MNETILRSCAVLLLALAGTAAHARADQPTLRIERAARGAVVQSITLERATFDQARGVLRATSTGGDRVCHGASTTGASQLLVLDGVPYGVEKIEARRGSFTVRPAGSGTFPLCVPSGPADSPRVLVGQKGIGGLNLSLDVIAEGNRVRREIAADGTITYRPGAPARLEARMSETVLCFERLGAGGKEASFSDPNGVQKTLLGLDAVDFRPSQRLLELDQSAGLLCFAPTDDPVTSLAPARSADDPVLCDEVADNEGLLLQDGFEATPAPAGDPASLQFDLRLVRAPSLDDSASLLYDYVVQNCGDLPLDNVTLREFWPGSGGSAPVRLVQSSSWEVCGESRDGCGPTVSGATGYVDLDIGTLAPRGEPGSRLVVRGERPLDRGVAGDLARIDAVALVNAAGAGVPEHASRSWAVEILQVGNARPDLLVGTGILPTPQNPVALVEDEGATVITSPSTFLLRVEDGDSGFDCAAGCLAVTSSDDSVIAPAGVRPVFVPQPDSFTGRLDLEITPRENGFGPVTLTIAAVDREGGVSEPLELSFAVEGRNDPPVFRIGAGGSFPPPGAKTVPDKAVEVAPGAFCELVQATPQGPFTLEDPSCPTHRWDSAPSFPNDRLQYTNFLSGVQAGPGETVGSVAHSVTIAEDPAGIIDQLSFDRATGQLTYELSGATGEATLRILARDPEGLETRAFVQVIVGSGAKASLSGGHGDGAAPLFDRASDTVLDLRPGEALTLSRSNLSASDGDSVPAGIYYVLTAIDLDGAEFRLAGRPLAPGDRFSQQDVDRQRLQLAVPSAAPGGVFGRAEFALLDGDGNAALNPVVLSVNVF